MSNKPGSSYYDSQLKRRMLNGHGLLYILTSNWSVQYLHFQCFLCLKKKWAKINEILFSPNSLFNNDTIGSIIHVSFSLANCLTWWTYLVWVVKEQSVSLTDKKDNDWSQEKKMKTLQELGNWLKPFLFCLDFVVRALKYKWQMQRIHFSIHLIASQF